MIVLLVLYLLVISDHIVLFSTFDHIFLPLSTFSIGIELVIAINFVGDDKNS